MGQNEANSMGKLGRISGGLKVGFYGCNDTLVRCSWVAEAGSRAPRAAMVDCPACGNSHPVGNFMWRAAHSESEFLQAHVHIPSGGSGGDQD